MVNRVISGLNMMIRALNRLHFNIPDWVPSIGGKSFGINISQIGNISIPRLATGAVIPPNAEFMAVLGDQKNGRNLEAPENLIRQIVREETEAIAKRPILVHAEVSGKTLMNIVAEQENEKSKADGYTIGVEFLHIKMNNLTITNILENSYKATLENVYSQAKRANSLKMIKVLIGQVYTVSVTVYDVKSPQMQQIQKLALLSEINVEFYDEDSRTYIIQNMYCKPINKQVKRELKNGEMFYEKVTLEFVGNEKSK